MSARAGNIRGALLIAALATGFAASQAFAQELQIDSKALDAGVSAAATGKKSAKGKARGAAAESQGAQSGKPQGGKTPDRQFGELEGWSPGKAPPKPKEQETTSSGGKATGLGVSPSGNMSVGLPF